MTTSSQPLPIPHRAMPEPLSGLPEPAVVELAPGRPFLSLSETNRLLRRQGLGPSLARAWVLEELVEAIPLAPDQEKALIRTYLEARQVSNEEALQQWLEQHQLSLADLSFLATREHRLQVFRQRRWGEEVETRFLQRKLELDQVVYSLLRVQSRELAEELHHRLLAGEAEFASLAAEFSTGSERHSGGRLGPLPLAAGHASLVRRLRVGRPGQVWPPFQAGAVWVVLRLDELQPARLNDDLRSRIIGELFEEWLQDRVRQLLAGEPLPPLAPLLALLEPQDLQPGG
ncbi:peptidylprolyl isomerase [Synechococcus sp. CBW1006]|uniref:peptidylprolyl isomerase n=1 Tax=Synechococcus sp. CBW1006 TaxID=1353138 RepID=UPI0018CE5663|nr:peptidylprolyl isomerase [Synechococcus sp. CBW1006]QPN65822.1 peptidylprolyl isomerase [Synechococcus sp. CBW1006]